METLKPAWVLIKYMDFCDSHIDSIMLLVLYFIQKSVFCAAISYCKVDNDGEEQRNIKSLQFLSVEAV